MHGEDEVVSGEGIPTQDGIEFWSRRWTTARMAPDRLPAFEDVGLGSIGAHAEGLALLEINDDVPRLLRSSKRFDTWLNDISEDAPRPDAWGKVLGMSRAALGAANPVPRRYSDIRAGRIQTRDLLAMPLASRWFPHLVLFYVDRPLASYGLTETVYNATGEGFLMLTPLRDEQGTIADFRVAAANPGAEALLRRDIVQLIGRRCSDLFADADIDIGGMLADVLKTGRRRYHELDLGDAGHEMHLRLSASTLDSLAVLTLSDVTELRAREAGFRLMFESNPVPMGLVDTATMRFLDVNTAASEHYGYAREQLVGAPYAMLGHPDDAGHPQAFTAVPAPDLEGARLRRHLRADGTEIAVRPYGRRLTIRRRPAALVAFFDVTESQRAETELRGTKLFVDTIIENIPSALLVEDAEDDRLLLINRTGEALLGLSRTEALGLPLGDPFALGASASPTAVERTFQPGGAAPLRLGVKKLDVQDSHGSARYRLTIAEDITERRAIEARIAHLAHHDALTDLPNRTLFAGRVTAAVSPMASGASGCAVLGVDLDAFKSVNDTLGHAGGDALLREVAARLNAAIRPGDSAARIGGDEFAVLISGPMADETAGTLAARLVKDLSRPFTIEGNEVHIGASIGIAVAPRDGDDYDTLLRNADLALYRAKEEGKSTFRFFEAAMNLHLQVRRDFERDLRRALVQGGFELLYQPVVSLEERRVIGCEALLRWHHPERGMVPPAEFIPLAEETGLIGPIGDWVLRQACSDAHAWPPDLQVAVNVSAIQFRDPKLIATVVSALASAGLAPDRLEIEITESVLLANTEAHLAMLHRLRDLGVKIAMDDFGTGYSSLRYLSTFPFDKIKIDQSFVRGIDTSLHCEAIIKAVVELGSHLGIVTVAEGVETAAQMSHLHSRGCRLAQGYLFSQPLAAPALRQWLEARSARSAAA